MKDYNSLCKGPEAEMHGCARRKRRPVRLEKNEQEEMSQREQRPDPSKGCGFYSNTGALGDIKEGVT